MKTTFIGRQRNMDLKFLSRSALVLFALGVFTLSAVADSKEQTVVRGSARFEVLSANLIRLEYSADRKFVDAASVAVQSRHWAATEFHTRESDGWLEISTGKMRLRYRLRSGAFGPTNLTISWSDEQGEHGWKPGDKDDKNLGGVPGDIALRANPGAELGPLSRNGYFFLDDSHTAVWNSASDWVEPRADKNGQDWYFFAYGRDFKGLLRELSQLFGPIPMIPRYLFGAWFSSRAGYSMAEWERIIRRFREERIPLDVIGLDSDSSAKIIWGGYDWDLEQMPDPRAFFNYANNQGIRVFANEHYDALTLRNSSNFERIRSAMNLPADTKEIPHDLASKKYAELFMDVLHKPALDEGLAFWWQDGNALAKMDGLDPTLWTRSVEYAGSERITGRRAFVFARLDVPYQKRNATPAWGVHRYGAFFTGDLVPHWSTLNLLVPFDVQAGNMLIPYVVNDSPGFYKQVIDAELYQRWVQFSVVSPLFWLHGIWGLRAPWEYGPDVLEATRKFLELRYSLIPYLYTYGRLAHETGEPLARGTYFEYPDQEDAYNFSQQYLLGKDILVAPISEPGFGQPVFKQIYLPAGDQWFDFFTGKLYEGGQVIAYECPLGCMPMFVRAGAILPLAPQMAYSDQRALDPLTLEIFAGKQGSFRLYEDDGFSLDYRRDRFSWTEFSYASSSASGHYIVTIGPSKGHYEGQPENRSYKICIHGLLKPGVVRLGSQPLPETEPLQSGGGWTWDDQHRMTTISLPSLPLRNPATITLEGAGLFATEQLLERVVDYRSRVRQVEIAEKLKWGMLLRGEDIKKEPRVLRETEQVEQELNDLVDHPENLEHDRPDFKAWTSRILAAFGDHPFESNRAIPELDSDAIKSTHSIENATFSPEEIRGMTATLLGCVLAAKASGDPSPNVIGRLDYDSGSMPGAQVIYEIELPEDNPPGWGEVSRKLDDQNFVHFETQAPFPPRPGPHSIRVKAVLRWNGGQTEVTRDVVWMSSGDPGS